MITKFLIFALLIICSTSALLENLFQRESTCYSGCQSNYADQTTFADACKKGCDYKFHNEKCADQCDLVSNDSQLKASCLVGCSMIDSMNSQDVEPSSIDAVERPRSIILIRLRQRPVLEFPSFNKDPAEFFRDMIQQMNSGASGELKTIIRLSPVAAAGIRADSSSESSEEQKMNMKHFVVFRQEHHQPSMKSHFQQVVDGVRQEWNDLIHRQPNVPIWLLLLLLLSLSAFLWYMIVSLCSHAPTHRSISIHADEKEKLQPIEHYVDTLPIKVKLTNI